MYEFINIEKTKFSNKIKRCLAPRQCRRIEKKSTRADTLSQEDAEIIELLFINFLKCFVHVPFFRRMSTVRTRDAARAPVQSAIQSYMEASRPGTKIW